MFSEKEIELAKELKRLKLPWQPRRGHHVTTRHCPAGCLELAPSVYLIQDLSSEISNLIWLPTFDELLLVAREFSISFSYVTDFLHRRRFADQNEREGFYQLLIEYLRGRSSTDR